MENKDHYYLFLEFLQRYLSVEFKNIDKGDPFITRLRETLLLHKQFFIVVDMIKWNVLFVCDTIKDILGIYPDEMDPALYFSLTHPDDISRHSIARARMIRLCNDTFIDDQGYHLMSTNLHLKNLSKNNYVHLLVQGYICPVKLSQRSVYCLFVNTNIDWFGPIKHGYHFYNGKDMSYFRLPDRELINTGCIFSKREYEILQLLRQGLDSNAVSEKLFLSTHTVDTHRRNILKKTGKSNTSELIIDLLEQGFF